MEVHRKSVICPKPHGYEVVKPRPLGNTQVPASAAGRRPFFLLSVCPASSFPEGKALLPIRVWQQPHQGVEYCENDCKLVCLFNLPWFEISTTLSSKKQSDSSWHLLVGWENVYRRRERRWSLESDFPTKVGICSRVAARSAGAFLGNSWFAL